MGVDPASIGVKVALMAVSYGLNMLNKIEGPRLDSLDVTTADYGTPLTYFYGLRRLEGVPIIWAERLREKKVTSKTKGGKYSEYKYFGTFAVAVADHPIDQITRVWMDKHLVYDVTKASPISALGGIFTGVSGAPVKLRSGKNVRFYYGSETQEPDPRMEAWCEDRYGADSCPAYRGVSYIVFEDLPLEKFGNRIPQITVEAVVNPTTNYLWDSEPATGANAIGFAPDYSRFYSDGSIWDTQTRQRLASISFAPAALGLGGRAYALTDFIGSGGGPFLHFYSNDGQVYDGFLTCPAAAESVWVFYDEFGNDRVFLGAYSGAGSTLQYYDGLGIVTVDIDFAATWFEMDSDFNVWVTGRLNGDSTVYLRCVSGARINEEHTFDNGSTNFVKLFINSDDEFILEQGGTLTHLANDFTLIQSGSVPATGTFSHARQTDTFWRTSSAAALEYSLKTLSQIRSLNEGLWSGAGDISGGQIDPVNHAIISGPSGSVVWRFLDRVSGSGVDLGDVVSDVSDRCNVPDYDVSDLDQLVTGYSWTQGSGKDILGPLLDIHDVDARPHDFSVQFIKRGNASDGTISEFVREGDEPRYTITIAQDTDIPRQITLNFADSGKDQQTNTVISQRPLDAADTVRTQQIDLTTYVATPAEAQKFADRYFRRRWNERETISLSLSGQYLSLEPGDVRTLALDGVSQAARLTKTTFSQGRINCEWVRDAVTLNSLGSGTGADMDGRDEETIFIPAPTKGRVVDVPLAEDAHDSSLPLLYYGAGDYGTGNWPGAIISEGSADGVDYSPWKGVDSSDKMTWGYAADVLGDANPRLWDRGNSVNVTSNSILTSVTEADIEADPTVNFALLGSEYINFTTATLESDGSYTLSGFKRGRRGTEWACSTHAAGDEFSLVSTMETSGLGLSEVGTTLYYKAQTLGRETSSAPTISFAFSGASLKPYAPARMEWTTDGTDLTGTITRRTRVGGSWDDDGVVPLSENSEAYEVDILDSGDVVRTITVTGTNVFTYTAAQISADGFTVASPPDVNVYQMSDAVGRGFALAA